MTKINNISKGWVTIAGLNGASNGLSLIIIGGLGGASSLLSLVIMK